MPESTQQDIHVIKYFSSFVSIKDGKVINITEPRLVFCPLAKHLYKDFGHIDGADREAVKEAIKKAIEGKIRDYGFFTKKRKLTFKNISIPYGASEMIMYALREKAIDSAVIVCEGAGTIITDKPQIAQGVGARMNSLLLTSPIKEVIGKLKKSGCKVIFGNALIDQIRGIEEAIKMGFKNIAVTIGGHEANDLKEIAKLEKEHNVSIISLVVCTTGMDKDMISVIGKYADLVWGCASQEVREDIGPLAIIQLSKQIPVFVLTRKGVDLVSAYIQNPVFIKNLDMSKQYLISHEKNGKRVQLGNFNAFVNEARLPAYGRRVPVFGGVS